MAQAGGDGMSEVKKFLCVGGPLDGRHTAILHGSGFLVAGDVAAEYKQETFATPDGEISVWVPRGQSLMETMNKLVQGYIPNHTVKIKQTVSEFIKGTIEPPRMTLAGSTVCEFADLGLVPRKNIKLNGEEFQIISVIARGVDDAVDFYLEPVTPPPAPQK